MTNEEIRNVTIQYELLNSKRDQVMKELNDLNLILNKIKPIIMRGIRQSTKTGNIPRRYLAVLDLRVRKGMTLEEVGKEFDITRERVRQVEAQTFDLLRKLN